MNIKFSCFLLTGYQMLTMVLRNASAVLIAVSAVSDETKHE